MSISDQLYKVLPQSAFVFLRNLYRKYQHFRYPKFSEEEFQAILTEKAGIKKGMTVFIHSSIDKLNLDFSPFRLLEILLETVGDEGTLLFPCWHYKGRAADFLKDKNAAFNVKKSPTAMGLLPELARRYPSAIRSLHPTASVVAIGKLAKTLTSEHHLDIYPNGVKSPLYKMMDYESRIIGLGERVVSLSFVHVVEDIMKDKFPVKTLEPEVRKLKVIDGDGKTQYYNTLIPSKEIRNRDIVKYMDKFMDTSVYEPFSVRGVHFFTIKPKELFAKMEKLAAQNITIYD